VWSVEVMRCKKEKRAILYIFLQGWFKILFELSI
jgi:hypothetical protein